MKKGNIIRLYKFHLGVDGMDKGEREKRLEGEIKGVLKGRKIDHIKFVHSAWGLTASVGVKI